MRKQYIHIHTYMLACIHEFGMTWKLSRIHSSSKNTWIKRPVRFHFGWSRCHLLIGSCTAKNHQASHGSMQPCFFPLPMIQFCTVAMVAHQSARCCSKHMTSCEEHFPAKFVFLLEEFGVIVVLAEQFPTRGLAIWFGHEMLTFCLNQKMNHVWK